MPKRNYKLKFLLKKKEKFNKKKFKIQRICKESLYLLPKLQGQVKDKKTIIIKRYLRCGFLKEKKSKRLDLKKILKKLYKQYFPSL